MNRHTVVLAEEKKRIESLMKKAVMEKPDNENLGMFRIAGSENELWSFLNDSVSILLLSSTFAQKPHNDFIKEILSKYPSIKIISLNHRYGDRSPLSVGAFDSVDKPIRNPVLWSKIDRAMSEIEELWIEDAVLSVKPSEDVVILKNETEVVIPMISREELSIQDEVSTEEVGLLDDLGSKTRTSNDNASIYESNSPTLDVSRETNQKQSVVTSLFAEEDEEEDDLFGTVYPTTKSAQTAPSKEQTEHSILRVRAPEKELLVEKEVEVELEELELIPEAKEHDTLFLITDEAVVSEDIPFVLPNPTEEVIPFVILEEEAEPPETSPLTLQNDREEILNETEHLSLEDDVSEHTIQIKEMPAPLISIPPVRAPRRVIERPPTDLEHKMEIFQESPSYDETSEWTKANEGFVAKGGEFVSLAPPRAQLRQKSNRVISKGSKGNETSNESNGLFSSVRNLFKK